MIRLGLAIDALSPQLTGIGRYTLELARRLPNRSGIENVAYFRFNRWYKDYGHFLESTKPPGGMIRHRIEKMRAPRQFKGRLVHGPNFFAPTRADLSVVTVHDLSVFRFPQFHPASRVEQFERNFMRAITTASHIITDSEFVRRELAEFSGVSIGKITSVPLGVSEAFFRQNADLASERANLARYDLADLDYILCVATLEPRKGLEQVIEAFERLIDRGEMRAHLVIAGAKGWHNDHLHRRIGELERVGKARLLGYVDEADLPSLYACARLFLYPSFYEGFGLPPIEAMASGVPTIVSDRSCLPEVTQGASMLVDPEDTEAFALAIERGLSDDRWRMDAVEAGLRVATGYSWDHCVEKTTDVYREVWNAHDWS